MLNKIQDLHWQQLISRNCTCLNEDMGEKIRLLNGTFKDVLYIPI